MKTAAIYVRCSTNHQSTENQKQDLTAYCERRGWKIFKVYEDKGVSGAKNSRPALDALMDDARKGKVDVVCVWKFDRFGRSLSHLINSLNEFQNLGIDFVSHNESMDTSTPAGRVLFSIIAAIAEFERALILERVKSGVAKAKEKGIRFGRPRSGFDFGKAVELRREGKSLREIARGLGVSHSTILRSIGAVM